MEVVAAPPPSSGGTPFRDHDVREWSRIDSITGALERARLETDSWTASTNDACHKYGKVVDSRARTGADGSLQAQASRQFEVFQSRAAGARLQVVKTKTVSSSRWTGKGEADIRGLGFEDLQLTLNPLDLSSEKSKASVGRSFSRRPPSRYQNSPLFSNDLTSNLGNAQFTAAANLHRVSRLCHQIHESAVRSAFGQISPPISQRNSIDSSVGGVEITEVTEDNATNSDVNSHSHLSRTKSTSSDDIPQILENGGHNKSSDLEELESWKRASKIRRSLQIPRTSSPLSTQKPTESNVNVKRIREELEKSHQLTDALKHTPLSVDLSSLDQIIQSISASRSLGEYPDNNISQDQDLKSNNKHKRDSFVTVESLQEVRGRLRRASSPITDFYNHVKSKHVDSDDGIVTEDTQTEHPEDIVNQQLTNYSIENMLQNKKPIIGTGSLESKSKLINGINNHKSEDWYNRRKSYGFEKVHDQEEPGSISLRNKKVAESSTDSGICRSNEIMIVPTVTKSNTNNRHNSESESDPENKYNSFDKDCNGINYGKVKKMTSIFSREDKNTHRNKLSDELTNAWNRRPSSINDNYWKKKEIKSTTITIPIVKNNNVVDLSWSDEPEKDIKRHSIAVDEAKYAVSGSEHRFRKTSLTMNEPYLRNDTTDDDNSSSNRKTKKVLFCKTEVHFAAESGKVNIVETDEKPPPTQNFRRRRRNSGPIIDVNESFNKNGLPMFNFGDSSFGLINNEEKDDPVDIKSSANVYENMQDKEARVPSAFSVVTVNTNNSNANHTEGEKKDYVENDSIKGILKNKPIKPKPYHLGESTLLTDSNSDEDARRWGVRLRHIPKDNPPIWKSTVTVHNSYYDNKNETISNNEHLNDDQPEFQKLLQNLRPMKKSDYMSDNENRYSDSFTNVRVVPAGKDSRRSSWSVTDKVNDTPENKVYSTKVNFGNGEAIVVQNDQSTWPRLENLSKDYPENMKNYEIPRESKKQGSTYNRYSIHSSKSKFSPVVLRKTIPVTKESKEGDKLEPFVVKPNKFHSPSLVARNTESSINFNNNRHPHNESDENKPNSTIQTKYIKDNNVVLRQPKKSEMTYFGVTASPKPAKKVGQTAVIKKDKTFSEEPDLLQHHKRSHSPAKLRPRKSSPENVKRRSESPIYENLKPLEKKPVSKYSSGTDFDSSILEELTKAADQILQAVNGYTDEDSQNRLSSEEEEPRKPLDTISETKSWKNSAQGIEMKNQQRMRPTLASAAKVRVKRTSSTSSIESLSKDRKKSGSTERKSAGVSKTTQENTKKKIPTDSNSVKASTKARRLQRASSREALLQSHGSSSEDLPAKIEAPLRKPRQIKKTKTAQLTVTNGIELKKPVRSREEKLDSNKNDHRILGSLSEIRHKTAVSTITSTVDKCSRDKSKERTRDRSRTEEAKLKSFVKRESCSKGTVSSSSNRPTSSSCRSLQHHSQRPSIVPKESSVTQHRISTANIKKCHRSEGTRY